MHYLYDFVREELEKVPGFRRAGKSYMIPCPFHPDTNPSLSVNVGNTDVPPGVFLCFGCRAHGTWNTLARKLGLRTFGPEEKRELKRLPIYKGRESIFQYSPPRFLEDLPSDFQYGKIAYSTLQKVGAKVWVDPVLNERRLLFLVSVLGEVKGHITLPYNRQKTKVKKARYSPGNWVAYSFWPYDYLPSKVPYVILVEGVRDALRLLQLGLNALSVLSITTWTDYKTELLLVKGVERVYLLFDGDNAGYKAASRLKKKLRRLVETIYVRFPPHEPRFDPYNCPLEFLDVLRRDVREFLARRRG